MEELVENGAKPKSDQSLKAWLIRFVKFALSIGFLYLVYSKIPFREVWEELKTSDFRFMVLAPFAFAISQWLSAIRQKWMLDAADFKFDLNTNTQLYWLGMFFNFFLPGGVGGDAYKVYLIQKAYKGRLKLLSAAIFADRLIGLLCLSLLTLALGLAVYYFKSLSLIPLSFGLIFLLSLLLAALGIAVFVVFFNKLFPTFRMVFFKALSISFFIQLFQMLSVLLICFALGIDQDILAAEFTFLLSSILSVVSIAGLGVREYIFALAAENLHFEPSNAVAIALAFTFATAFVSFFGLYFYLKGIQLRSYDER